MSATKKRPGDKTNLLVSRIRDSIISGEMPPGCPLRQETLAASYRLSRVPIREALRTLETEGLVQLVPNKGAIVAPIDLEELREIYEMRDAAETLALKLSIPEMSNTQIDIAQNIHNEMTQCDEKEICALNRKFHEALYLPSKRKRLLAHISCLHDIAERYLRFTLKNLDYVERSAEEHVALLKACRKRDLPSAIKILSSHITQAGKELEEYLRANPSILEHGSVANRLLNKEKY